MKILMTYNKCATFVSLIARDAFSTRHLQKEL